MAPFLGAGELPISARLVLAGRGKARYGRAGLGTARLLWGGEGVRPTPRQGQARRGMAGPGLARLGVAWRGAAWRGPARLGPAGRGRAWLSFGTQGEQADGSDWRGESGHGGA